jgi:hypothetical protein
VGSRQAAGNSSTAIYYSIVDETSQQAAYYRLKQIDQNGDYEYYQLGSVECSTQGVLTLFPNPTRGLVTLRYDSFESIEDAIIEVVDVYGKLHYSKPTQISEGNNEFVIDLSNFADATYFIHINTPNGTYKPVKIVKMN